MAEPQASSQAMNGLPNGESSSAPPTPLAIPQETIDLVTAEHTTTITASVSLKPVALNISYNDYAAGHGIKGRRGRQAC